MTDSNRRTRPICRRDRRKTGKWWKSSGLERRSNTPKSSNTTAEKLHGVEKASRKRSMSRPSASKEISRKPKIRADAVTQTVEKELTNLGNASKSNEENSSFKILSETDFKQNESEYGTVNLSPKKLEAIKMKQNRGGGNSVIPLHR